MYSKYHYVGLNSRWVRFTIPESAEPNRIYRRKVRHGMTGYYFLGENDEKVLLGWTVSPMYRRSK